MAIPMNYNYDRDKVYIGSRQAKSSPLEPNIYLTPARATIIKIPIKILTGDKVFVFNETTNFWEEKYDYRGIHFFEIDANKFFIGKIIVGAISDIEITYPRIQPPNTLLKPKWDGNVWIEGDQICTVIDDNGLPLKQDYSTRITGTQTQIIGSPPNTLLKPKWDGSTWIESETIIKLRKEKIRELKKEVRKILAEKVDWRMTKYLSQQFLVSKGSLTKTDITETKYKAILEKAQTIRDQSKSIEVYINGETVLQDLYNFVINITIPTGL